MSRATASCYRPARPVAPEEIQPVTGWLEAVDDQSSKMKLSMSAGAVAFRHAGVDQNCPRVCIQQDQDKLEL